jgi:hypothetical protein
MDTIQLVAVTTYGNAPNAQVIIMTSRQRRYGHLIAGSEHTNHNYK